MEEQREDLMPCILSFLCITTRYHRRIAATGYRLNDLITGGCNNLVMLPKKPEVAPPTFVYMGAAVRR